LSTLAPDGAPRWAQALTALRLFAIDPVGLGGIHLRAAAGVPRDVWLARLRALLPADAPVRRMPARIGDDGLLGGLDLAATLKAGRAIATRGLLAHADGGVVVLAMAERVAAETAARLAAVMDSGNVALARDGISVDSPARFGLVALDEAADADERMPATLSERLAFRVELDSVRARAADAGDDTPAAFAAARARLAGVAVDDGTVEAVCAAAVALGVQSVRAELLTLRAARAAAAFAGRDAVAAEDVALAAALVLAHRATRLPAEEEPAAEPPPPEPPPQSPDATESGPGDAEQPLDDVVLAAVAAAIPAGLLARLKVADAMRARAKAGGRAGALMKSGRRGRPAGIFRGAPRTRGARLDLVATLRAAAPWQQVRARDGSGGPRVRVLPDDFRIVRYRQRSETTTIFAIDASGSAALHRLAETKGAVELLLADCYVRRDSVSVLAFRGRGAEIVLPPTRSLVRAKRALAGLPGGGGTPLAAGIEAGLDLALAARRRGGTPTLVLLTDGRANVDRDGIGGRDRAEADALAAAGRLRAEGIATLLVDTAPRPTELARALGAAMGAVYLALPHADAGALNRAVRGTMAKR
jgi:magnesium chelatase subunit D